MSKGRTMPVVLEDQELRPENRLLTISKYCDIKKLLLIVCALSVKLGAGPSAWGLPGSSIAYVVKVVRSVRAGSMTCWPPSDV